MRTLTWLLGFVLFVVASGCSGSSSGGSNTAPSGGGGASAIPSPTPIGTGAIDATLPALTATLLAGGPTLDPAITSGAVPNPVVASSDTTQTVVLGAKASDGTAGSVQVRTTVSRDPTGLESVTTTVQALPSQVAFLTLFMNVEQVVVSFRLPPLGVADLAGDGTGQAFILARYAYSGTVRREFENDRSGLTLIDYGGGSPPAPTVSQLADFSGFLEYLVSYTLTNSPSGIVARVTATHPANSGLVFARRGGPGAASVTQTLDVLTVDGIGAVSGGVTVAAIGLDIPSTGTASATAPVALVARFGGGVPGGIFSSDMRGFVAPQLTDALGFAVNYNGNLAGLDAVDDGVIQVDRMARLVTRSRESPGANPLVHSLEGQLGALSASYQSFTAELEQLVYLPNLGVREQALILYR